MVLEYIKANLEQKSIFHSLLFVHWQKGVLFQQSTIQVHDLSKYFCLKTSLVKKINNLIKKESKHFDF